MSSHKLTLSHLEILLLRACNDLRGNMDGIMDSAVVVRAKSMRPPEKQEANNINLHNNAITRALTYAADQFGTRDWRSAHPNLAAWFAHMSERASVRATLAG